MDRRRHMRLSVARFILPATFIVLAPAILVSPLFLLLMLILAVLLWPIIQQLLKRVAYAVVGKHGFVR